MALLTFTILYLIAIGIICDFQERLDDISSWIDDANIIYEEEKPIYEDNAEWSWGHNIKNHMEEEL